MKLLLFDLDGSVRRATRGAAPCKRAMREIFGVEPERGVVSFDGKTDPVIVEEIPAHARSDVRLDEAALQSFEKRLALRLDEALDAGETYVDSTPGVRRVLEAL